MRIGPLRDRLTIQTYTDVIAANGETTKTWTTFATVYGEIRPTTGREFMAADKVRAEISHVIIIRFISGLLPKMRITSGSRTFEIVSALPDRKNNTMYQIFAREKIN